MKKLVLIMLLALLTVLVVVSCGESTPATTAKETSSASKDDSTKAPALVTTTSRAETTPADTTSVSLPDTTAAPATATPAVTTPVTTTPVTTTPATTAPVTTATPITYTAKSWMGAIPDATPLNQIAMPGTHDSGATKDMILSGTAKCQTLSIADQLNAGVRFFDIRLRRVNGALHVYHGYVDQKLTFDEVLSACYTFLAENPSESLIMCIKEEYDASGTNDSFASMVAAKINEQAGFWHTNPAIPKLGDIRGKIVLMRRYGGVSNFGINASNGWSDNTTFTLNAGTCVLSVQDYYNNESADAKWSAISSMFRKMKVQQNTYYLNYTSGYKSNGSIPNINTIKDAVNPKLIEYLKTSPDFVGILVVDFVTPEIAELIYEVNFQ